MTNSPFTKILNKKFPLEVLIILKQQRRSYIDTSKHLEPLEYNWQWTARGTSEVQCKHKQCVNLKAKCPPKSFFPKFKKTYIPAEVVVEEGCPDKEAVIKKSVLDRLTDYFSYLLPDHMQEARNAKRIPLESCRALAAIRRDKCQDPYGWECCDCDERPKEWYNQGVIHLIVGPEKGIFDKKDICLGQPKRYEHPEDLVPCPPPDYMIPREILAKRGVCQPAQVNFDKTSNSLPYEELWSANTSGDVGGMKPFTFKSKKKCFSIIPPVRDKATKLSCRFYEEFKTVECPPQLYTRFKSVQAVNHQPLRPITPCQKVSETQEKPALLGKCHPPSRKMSSEATEGFSKQSKIVDKKTLQDICPKRVCPKCPKPKNPKHPEEPISNPYWDNKERSFSICNNPDNIKGKPVKIKKEHIHTSAAHSKTKESICPTPESEKKSKRAARKEAKKDAKRKAKEAKEKKNESHTSEREPCNSKPKKKERKGFFCKLAKLVGKKC